MLDLFLYNEYPSRKYNIVRYNVVVRRAILSKEYNWYNYVTALYDFPWFKRLDGTRVSSLFVQNYYENEWYWISILYDHKESTSFKEHNSLQVQCPLSLLNIYILQ